jgi:hypothetical protein
VAIITVETSALGLRANAIRGQMANGEQECQDDPLDFLERGGDRLRQRRQADIGARRALRPESRRPSAWGSPRMGACLRAGPVAAGFLGLHAPSWRGYKHRSMTPPRIDKPDDPLNL